MNMLFGNKIKELRDENGIMQRQLAALLEIDTPMFSKIERGDRRAKREQVIKLAEYFHQDENEMLTLWLADKVLDAVDGEQELGSQAIEIAQEKNQRAVKVWRSKFFLYPIGRKGLPETWTRGSLAFSSSLTSLRLTKQLSG